MSDSPFDSKRPTSRPMDALSLSLPWALDVEDERANDALLGDLFTFLDSEAPTFLVDDAPVIALHLDTTSVDASASPSPSTSPMPRPAPRRKRSKAKQVCPIKRESDALRDEAQQLTDTLHRLREDASRTHNNGATEVALTERFKRRRAEQECEQLRDAVYAQAQFLKGLQSVFSAPPSFASGLNLCRHLHNYTRLPRERSVRWNEYAALCQETRLQRAMDILCRETQALTCNERGDCDSSKQLLSSTVDAPCVQSDVIIEADGFGITSTSVYALETRDIGAVARGACVAVRDALSRCSSYKCTSLTRQIVDPEAASSPLAANMMYRVVGVRHKSLRADSDELSIESRLVTLYKQTDDFAIVLWDFVDDDELHPTTDRTDITRQAIGACLVRREICDDGVERTVCRQLNTRSYRFHKGVATDKLGRFQRLLTTSSDENEHLFRSLVMDSIAKEEAAYARVVRAMRAY